MLTTGTAASSGTSNTKCSCDVPSWAKRGTSSGSDDSNASGGSRGSSGYSARLCVYETEKGEKLMLERDLAKAVIDSIGHTSKVG